MFKFFFIFITLFILFFSKSHGQSITNDCSNCGKPIAPGLIIIPKLNNKEVLNSEIYKNNENVINSSKWLSHESKSVVRNNFGQLNFSILMAPKPCPTNYRWFWGYEKYEVEAYGKFKQDMEKKLFEYPDKTKNFCTKKNFLILKNKLTNHLNNHENLARTTGTMLWEKNSQKIILKVIVESNYLNKKPEGVIYNENLEKICDTFTTKQGNVRNTNLKCIGVSEDINAIVNVTDFKLGKFKAFGVGGGYKIFLTNLGFTDAMDKYPDIFAN
jgi:hypothetical protein